MTDIDFTPIRKLLKGAELDLFDSMPREDKLVVLKSLKEFADDGHSRTAEELKNIDYVTTPVDIETFLRDPYYLGWMFDDLYPAWVDELIKVHHEGSQVQEWILTGCIGGGKSFNATVSMLYSSLYKLSCYRDPQRFFGLADNTPIAIGLFNVFKYKAKSLTWQYLENFVMKSPYFRERFPRDSNYKNDLFFPHQCRVLAGATALQAIGENLFSVMIDEVDFMRGGAEENQKSQAYDLYVATARRMSSRFMRGGVVPGILYLVTSKTHESSFANKRIEIAESDPRIHVSDFALWEIGKPDMGYSGKKFFVVPGTRYRSTHVCKIGESVPEGDYIEVPVEHFSAFEQDPDGALRDIAGISSAVVSPLIPVPERIKSCVDPSRKHPFYLESITISLDDKDRYGDYLDLSRLTEVKDGVRRPRLNPGIPRFFHIDIGLSNDSLGMAMGHAVPTGWNSYRRSELAHTYETPDVRIMIDFMLRVTPPAGSQIDLDKTVEFMFALRSLGFNIIGGSYDGYQSAHSVQIFRKVGWEVAVLSIDAAPSTPYMLLRGAILEERISYYEYEPFMTEVLRLKKNEAKRKVDHPKGGSKDVADAVAGVVYHCMTNKRAGVSDVERDREALMTGLLTQIKDPMEEFSWLLRDHKGLDFDDAEIR